MNEALWEAVPFGENYLKFLSKNSETTGEKKRLEEWGIWQL